MPSRSRAAVGAEHLGFFAELAGVRRQPRLGQHVAPPPSDRAPSTYSMSGLTATAWFDGSVHGVVVQTSR